MSEEGGGNPLSSVPIKTTNKRKESDNEKGGGGNRQRNVIWVDSGRTKC